MATEIFVQAAILILTLAIFFAIQYVPTKAVTKHRTDNRATTQTQRHVTRATHLLSRAKSNPHKDQSETLAKTAIAEIEKALSISPKDPTPHLLKSLALDLLGHRGSALRSLDLALASSRVKSLAEKERVEALVRRAELKLAVNKRRRVDSAVTDLEEAVRLSKEEEGGVQIKTASFCLLGECYEFKGLKEKAKKAFNEALKIEPESSVARQGLERLNLS
ncbi:Tetratricopeptide-like helical [Corchorus capsularis]|uniref:Tetratricopeptide-like helical n=1 Tax=Corchorus capsularis TaxID=210143 RepID=A0A1R3GE64_COCAP|nr:Tetratricopeptide-like helical [Corchorus capsularis]